MLCTKFESHRQAGFDKEDDFNMASWSYDQDHLNNFSFLHPVEAI